MVQYKVVEYWNRIMWEDERQAAESERKGWVFIGWKEFWQIKEMLMPTKLEERTENEIRDNWWDWLKWGRLIKGRRVIEKNQGSAGNNMRKN